MTFNIWARTIDTLLYSEDFDTGPTWNAVPILGDFSSRGDKYSLAALDSYAYLSVLGDSNGKGNNFNTLSFYNIATNTWSSQRVLNSLNGTGAGGRRFVKTFYLTHNPPLPQELGKGQQLFFCGGQDVLRARGFLKDAINGMIDWEFFAQVLSSNGSLHADIWDFHMINDFDDPGPVYWIAGDGGVFEKSSASGETWKPRVEKLHTHHSHGLTVLPGTNNNLLAYGTQDNEAWWRKDDGKWEHESELGDTGWTAGDTGNPGIALVVRNFPTLPASDMGNCMLTGFGNNLPNGSTTQRFAMIEDETFNGPTGFQFIQTLPGESVDHPFLDAVMLADLPLKDATGNQLPDPAGGVGANSRRALLRNRQFAKNPDGPKSQFKDWQIELDNLPFGCQRFWVSGGHLTPVYYFHIVDNTKQTCKSGLFKWSSSAAKDWSTKCLLDHVMDLSVPGYDHTLFGPVFVNPYDTNHLFVLTDSTVNISVDGGTTFTPDHVLTALLTDSGKYSYSGTFAGGNEQNVVIGGNVVRGMAILSHVAFLRDNPRKVVVASPYTGAFYTSGDSQWRNLTPYLPDPLSSISSVGIDSNAIYLATEGRGIFRITGYQNAPINDVSSNISMFGFDLGHTRFTPYETVLAPTNVSNLVHFWTTLVCLDSPAGIDLVSSPAVVNGIVYVGSNDHQLYAINASTGKILWTAVTLGEIPSSPAVANGVVYIGSIAGSLYAFDAATGVPRWRNEAGNIFSSPAVANGVVYSASYQGNLSAFDASTGSPLWNRVVSTGLINSSPAVVNEVVYIGSDDGKLYAFDATTGTPLWTFPTSDRIRSSPAVANGVVYIGSDDGQLYAVNATTGMQVWVFSVGSRIRSSSAVANGVVYISSDDGKLSALNASSGQIVWSTSAGTGVPTGGDIQSSPMVANGVVYIGFYSDLYAFDASTGQTLWSVHTPNQVEASPTVANGVVYVGSRDGKLYVHHLSG